MEPNFLKWKHLAFEDKSLIESFVRSFPPYSDFNFVSLWSYDTEKAFLFCFLNGNLAIEFRDYLTLEPFYSFLGTKEVTKTAEILLDYAKEKGTVQELRLIPQITAACIPATEDSLIVTIDDTNHDYILSVDEIALLSGNKYGPKRNFVNRFTLNYPHCIVKEISLMDSGIQTQILSVFYTWEKRKHALRQDTVIELTAIERLLEKAGELELHSVGLFDNERMIGFSLNEIVTGGYAIIHFEKADKEYVGAFQYLKQRTAQLLKEKNVEFINYEQDFGTEGLRQAKRSYHPVHFLEKYTIKKR